MVIYATGRQKEKDDKTPLCVKRGAAITGVFCHDLKETFGQAALILCFPEPLFARLT